MKKSKNGGPVALETAFHDARICCIHAVPKALTHYLFAHLIAAALCSPALKCLLLDVISLVALPLDD